MMTFKSYRIHLDEQKALEASQSTPKASKVVKPTKKAQRPSSRLKNVSRGA